MVDVRIVDFDETAAMEMASKMRPMDKLEYDAGSNGAPIEMGMRHMLRVSELAKAAYVDGELLCCWGRIRKTILTSECCPWMVATSLIEEKEAKRVFLKEFPKYLDELTTGFNRSWNMVYEGNKLTIRWLRFAGFDFVGDPVTVRGFKFLPFEKRNVQNVL